MNLDKKDRKILSALEMGARLTYQQIGREAALSKESVLYRIRRLEKREIIQRYTTLINFGKLGYTGFAVYSRLENVDNLLKKEVIDYIAQLPQTYWITPIGGKFDIVFGLLCKNVFEFNKIYHTIMNRFGKHLFDPTIAIRTELHQTRREYLSKSLSPHFQPPYFGNNLDVETLDELDKRILSELSMNARINVIKLSEILKTPASTLSARMRRMEDKGIIQRYWTYIKSQNFGMQSYRLLLQVHYSSEAIRHKIFEYAHANPHAVLAIETVGPWNFEMTFEVENQEQLQKEISNLRDRFKEVIRNVEFLIMFEDNLIYDPYPFLKSERKIKMY